ncbi:MAG: sigma-54-dependent Fis family transcriptional regulator [Methylococcales bacterium]|nr:sigma-54-dependent Fis family transcriptional regulator [Methylococcales bacterium]
MKQYDVLVVEDDLDLCEALSDTLAIEGYRVLSAHNGTEALSKLAKYRFRLVVSDIQMPVMDGFQLLNNMQQKHPEIPVLLMTAYGTVPKAVEAMQSGAADYLIKPFEASTLVEKVAEFVVIEPETINDRIVFDEKMKKLYTLTAKVAKTEVTVLLQGESGTGKEVIARYIHENSLFHDGPFVAVNCAAIPENMLEAMLFGYEKGAFTGAVQSMPGKFEQAQGGTILLDEISEMDISLQAKLLRVLQEKEVERLGSQHKIELNVRFLATTNRKLKESVEQGLFREDLYYRLSVFPIKIPALKDRAGDILPLAMELLKKHGQEGKPLPKLTSDATEILKSYAWPGNVRELENVMQRALILQQKGVIHAECIIFEGDMDEQLQSIDQAVEIGFVKAVDDNPTMELNTNARLGDSVKSVEENIILQTLKDEQGSRKITAEKLGISPRTLRYKIARMKESGVAVPC